MGFIRGSHYRCSWSSPSTNTSPGLPQNPPAASSPSTNRRSRVPPGLSIAPFLVSTHSPANVRSQICIPPATPLCFRLKSTSFNPKHHGARTHLSTGISGRRLRSGAARGRVRLAAVSPQAQLGKNCAHRTETCASAELADSCEVKSLRLVSEVSDRGITELFARRRVSMQTPCFVFFHSRVKALPNQGGRSSARPQPKGSTGHQYRPSGLTTTDDGEGRRATSSARSLLSRVPSTQVLSTWWPEVPSARGPRRAAKVWPRSGSGGPSRASPELLSWEGHVKKHSQTHLLRPPEGNTQKQSWAL